MILAEFDKTFKYDDQVEMPRAFENFFCNISRRDDQILLNFLSLASILGFDPFIADSSTAFLQGKSFNPKSDKEFWIKLPREANTLLGRTPGHGGVMKLTKLMMDWWITQRHGLTK